MSMSDIYMAEFLKGINAKGQSIGQSYVQQKQKEQEFDQTLKAQSLLEQMKKNRLYIPGQKDETGLVSVPEKTLTIADIPRIMKGEISNYQVEPFAATEAPILYIKEGDKPGVKKVTDAMGNEVTEAPKGSKYIDATNTPTMASVRQQTNEIRQNTYDRTQFQNAVKSINSLDQSGRKAVGIAGLNNMRADRVIEVLGNPGVTNQDISNAVADIAAIYKGGVPDQLQMEHSDYKTFIGDLTNLAQYLSGTPKETPTDEIKQKLLKVTKEIKDVDNQVIADNIGIQATGIFKLLEKEEYKKQWDKAASLVGKTTKSPSERPQTEKVDNVFKDKSGLTNNSIKSKYANILNQ